MSYICASSPHLCPLPGFPGVNTQVKQQSILKPHFSIHGKTILWPLGKMSLCSPGRSPHPKCLDYRCAHMCDVLLDLWSVFLLDLYGIRCVIFGGSFLLFSVLSALLILVLFLWSQQQAASSFKLSIEMCTLPLTPCVWMALGVTVWGSSDGFLLWT